MKDIKNNRYTPYKKQLSLINFLRNNRQKMKNISFHGTFPTDIIVGEILDLCERHIFDEKDKNRTIPFRAGQLKVLINFYTSNRYKSPRDLINHKFIRQYSNEIDTRIKVSFQLISQYCEFKIPKYLRCFQNIYTFVKEEKQIHDVQCNLEGLLLKLEFGTTNPIEIELRAMGLPRNITQKLTTQKSPGSIDEVQQNFKEGRYSELNSFEKRLVRRYL